MKHEIKDILSKLNSENSKANLRELSIVEKSVDEESRTAEFSVSSDKPYERWFGSEILDHSEKSIRMDRFKNGAALRDTHYGDQIGIIEKAWIDSKEKKLRIKARFSKSTPRADEVFKDITDGIRRNVSIRYIVHEMILEKENDEGAVYRVTDWEPIHASMEPDPADFSVGVGRSNENKETTIQLDANKNIEEQVNEFNKTSSNIKILFNKKESKKMLTPEEQAALEKEQKEKMEKAVKDAGAAETERVRAINSIANDFKKNVPGLDKMADEAIGKGTSEAEFRKDVMAKFKDPQTLRTPDTELGMGKKDIKDYSIRKIILYQLGKLSEKDLGLELDAARALEKQLGNWNSKENGILIPADIMHRRTELNFNRLSTNERGLLAGTDASGGYTVKDQYVPQSFIEMIQNALAFAKVGVNVLTGLVGNIPMTRELDNYTYYWAGEGSGITESDITFGQETMSPKKGGALGRFSYEFLNQSSLAVESYIERRLAIACALGGDRAIGYGTGTSNQPKGIKNWTGIGSTVVGTDFDLADALAMEASILDSVGAAYGNPQWLAKGSIRSLLKGREQFSGTGKTLVDNNEMIGYDFKNISNQFDANDLMLGIFSTVIYGMWDMFSVKASEFDDTAFKAGDVLVRGLQFVDTFVEQPGAIEVVDALT